MPPVPDTNPGQWDIVMQRGATWPATTIEWIRDGVAVIPVSAALRITDPDGTLVVGTMAVIDGGGVMTIGPLSAVTTAAYTWTYGNVAFTVVESGSVTTLLLAGNATLVNRTD